MSTSTIQARLQYDVATVWGIITSFNDYRWRSDIAQIEKLSDYQFIEYTRSGYATLFTITIFQPFERYEFDLENENIKGHWCGLLSERDEQTEIVFTETIFVKKWYLKPFAKMYLRRQQSIYLKDLCQKLFHLAVDTSSPSR